MSTYTRDKIASALYNHGPMTKKQLLATLPVTMRTVERGMRDLMTMGAVANIGTKPGTHESIYELIDIPSDATKEDPIPAMMDPNNPIGIDRMIEFLRDRGMDVVNAPKENKTTFISSADDYLGDEFRVGVISDTHLGSIDQQLTNLETMYDIFNDEGITHVLHSGDLMDGGHIYSGQEYRMFKQGVEQQVDYATKYYPKRSGITTHTISGNHDLSFKGVDVTRWLGDRRSDINYLGDYSRDITLGGVTFRLHHGARGASKARSGVLQQYIDNMRLKHDFDVLVLGHYHVTATLEEHNRTYGILPGCFQGQTEYIRRLGYDPDIGGSILKFRIDKNGNMLSRGRDWYAFDEILNDY